MGKVKRAKKGRAGKGKAKAAGAARSKATLALVHKLDSSETEERLQGCIALGNLFGDLDPSVAQVLEATNAEDEAMSDAVAVDQAPAPAPPQPTDQFRNVTRKQQQGDLVDDLVASGAFRVLMKRVTDADAQVRLHACGALSTILTACPVVAEQMVADGIHTAALAVVRNGPGGTILTREVAADATRLSSPGSDEQSMRLKTLGHAIELLCLLCNASEVAVRALEDDAVLIQLGELLAHQEPALELAACATAELLDIALDGNRALSTRLASAGNGAVLARLEAACVDGALMQRSPIAALHCTGALGAVAVQLANPVTVDPAKVFARQVALGTAIFADTAIDAAAADAPHGLVLEILTNSCSSMVSGLDSAELDSYATRSAQAAADVIAQAPLCKVVAGLLEKCEADLESPLAGRIGPRACGLLDNVVQNASESVLRALGPQDLWQFAYRLMALIVAARQLDDQAQGNLEEESSESVEELGEALCALLWSLARRAQQLSVPVLCVSQPHLIGIVGAANQSASPNARANLIGCLTALGMPGPIQVAQEDFAKVALALKSCVGDSSRLVAVQAVDGLIDIFSDDARDPIFQELLIFPTLRSARLRLRSSLADRALPMDRDAVETILANLDAFLDYKSPS